MCLGIKISCIYLRYKKLRRRNRAAPIHHKVGHFMSSNNSETIYFRSDDLEHERRASKAGKSYFFLFIHCISFLFKVAKIDNSKFDRYFFPAQFRVRNQEVFKKCESLYGTGKYSLLVGVWLVLSRNKSQQTCVKICCPLRNC